MCACVCVCVQLNTISSSEMALNFVWGAGLAAMMSRFVKDKACSSISTMVCTNVFDEFGERKTGGGSQCSRFLAPSHHKFKLIYSSGYVYQPALSWLSVTVRTPNSCYYRPCRFGWVFHSALCRSKLRTGYYGNRFACKY